MESLDVKGYNNRGQRHRDLHLEGRITDPDVDDDQGLVWLREDEDLIKALPNGETTVASGWSVQHMATGTLTADGTEQVVDTLDLGVPEFVFWYVDLSNLSDQETLIIRERIDVDGDGTYEKHTVRQYTNSQDVPVISQSNSLMTHSGVPVRITLEETEGAGNDYPWARG